MEYQMWHILLDTNIFVDFVNSTKEEHYLERIIRLAEEGTIQMLVPDLLLQEWNEKRDSTLQYISKTFDSTISISKNEATPALLKGNFKHAQVKASSVDKLLSNGIFIKTMPKVKSDTVDRSINHKAPFHDRKTKTINDAVIFFSTTYYLKKNKIPGFVFVTKDAGDFGDPLNRSEMLHHELDDSELEILYFTSLFKCFDKFKDEWKVKPDKEDLYQLIISKRGKKNLLDHLYDVITAYKSKINFLPTFILSKIEPFKISNPHHDYSYHAGNTLLTNNKELIDFFKQVDVKKNRFKKGSQFRNTKNNTGKLEYILEALNDNLVFHISYITGDENISILRNLDQECPCAICSFRRLSYGATVKDIYHEKDELKRAFVLFQLGEFMDSLRVYFNIYQNAVKEENHVLSYRILLIMHWVAQYADYGTSENDDRQLIQKVRKLDRETAFYNALNGSKLEREIALFLHGSTMFDHFKLDIKEHTEKIRQHYNSQLKASYSSNSNLQNLTNSFLNFEMFTICNGMAYTRYTDFEGICDDFVEGIFMCSALNIYQSSRIEHLYDFLLERLLYYGRADKMIVHFNRYLKKNIPYKSENRDFEKVVLNFLRSDVQTIEQFSGKKFWEGSHSFYKIFWNLLLLLSIVEFPEDFVIICSKHLTKFLENLPKWETHQLIHLASFIHSKGKILKTEILNDLFRCIIKNPLLHNEEVFAQFSSIKGYNFKLKLTKKEFDDLNFMFFNKCETCGEFHKNILFHLHSVLPVKYKLAATKKANELLKQKFDADLYYLCVLGNIIDYKPFFTQYLAMFRPIKKSRESYYHLNGEINFRPLSNLMNLVFKTKATLPKEFVNQFKGISDYYDWVLDMKNFEYSRFSPIWIIQYPTRYYLEQAFSVKELREAVRKYLQTNNQPTLAYYYSQYFQ